MMFTVDLRIRNMIHYISYGLTMPLNDEMKTEKTRMLKFDIDGVKSRMMTICGQMTQLDRDVAELYGVATREINQAVRNNPDKFPEGCVVVFSGRPYFGREHPLQKSRDGA